MDKQESNQQSFASSTPNIIPTRKDKSAHGKRYTLTQKLAVKALLDTGMSPTQIQRQEKMDKSTVYNVMKDQRIDLLAKSQVDSIKNSLIGLTYANAYRAQSAITDEKLESSSFLQLMTGSAIGIEKGRLMENLSTDNVSFRGISQSIDEDRQKIMSRFKDLET